MTDTDVLKESLRNVQSLLTKIDGNQTKLFDTQSGHAKELERLNGLIEKGISTNRLELKSLGKDIRYSCKKAEDAEGSVDKLETEVDNNTKFRQNMEGFSWARHGIPVGLFLIALVSLIITFMKQTPTP